MNRLTTLCLAVVLLASINGVPLSGAQNTIDNPVGLVGYWPLVSNGENSVADNCKGLIVGNAAFEDGALALTGGYVAFGTNAALSITGSISCGLWIRPCAGNRLMRILGKFNIHDGDNREYAVFLGPDNRIWVVLSDDGTVDEAHAIVVATANPLTDQNVWHHIAFAWDASKGADGLTIYVDGKTVGTAAAQNPGIQSIHAGTAGLTLGTYDVIAGATATTNSFEGSVCGLLLCRGVLPDAAIIGLYELGRNGTPEDVQTLLRVEKANNLESKIQPDSSEKPGSGKDAIAQVAVVVAHEQFGVIHVNANTGDDGFDGMSPDVKDRVGGQGPKKTMNGAFCALQSGGTIIVKPGVYHEKVRVPAGIRMICEGRVVIEREDK